MENEINILYFASLAESLARDDEKFELPSASTISSLQLKKELATRGSKWEVLLEPSTRCSVNLVIASDETEIKPGDEVAFFPPVTGG